MTPATFAQTNRLFAHCLEQLERHPATTSPVLTEAQNALLAYLRFDQAAEEEGLAALIARGCGEEVLCGVLPAQLAAWGEDEQAQAVRQAAVLYRAYGQEIARRAALPQEGAEGEAWTQLAAWNETYFMNGEAWFAGVYRHVRRHFADFAPLLAFQAA